ncbi:MAG: tRNA pseudouridine(55) synthase TruB [Betaproteobacteria bacterium]|nr:tRNA pseudouridine(55) synthase TruB [Betaproteobacteria bacterium]
MSGGPDGVLLVDKPAGITSTRALALAKRALGSRKAGHTGTLDPFATGLLPLVFGEATKFSRFLIDADKTYLATLRLGASSTTGDTEGEILECGPVTVDFAEIAAISREFVGLSTQVPPMHSAIRVQGQRLYDLARQGVEVPRAPRGVRIDFLDIVEFFGEKLVISVKCSKGTYIRVLAEDIGKRLGCGAYLTDLRRTETGGFLVGDAAGIPELEAMGPGAARRRLLPVEVLVRSLPRTDLEEREAWAIRNGQVMPADPAWATGDRALFGPGGKFIGVGVVVEGRLEASRLMATDASAPG